MAHRRGKKGGPVNSNAHEEANTHIELPTQRDAGAWKFVGSKQRSAILSKSCFRSWSRLYNNRSLFVSVGVRSFSTSSKPASSVKLKGATRRLIG